MGGDSLTLVSMSHDLNVFHAMLGQNYPKSLYPKLRGQSPLVLVCLIRDISPVENQNDLELDFKVFFLC